MTSRWIRRDSGSTPSNASFAGYAVVPGSVAIALFGVYWGVDRLLS